MLLIMIAKSMKDSELIFKLAQRIKMLRKAKGLTLREFEAMTNIENSNIARLESGSTDPRLTTLYKISQALDISLSELLKIE